MDFLGLSWHQISVLAAVVFGPIGCLVSFWYCVRPERRDAWRGPMLIGAVLATGSIVAAYLTGEQLLNAHPDLAVDAQVGAHQDYAERLLLPTIGFFVMAATTGTLHPRTGALRLLLPPLLACFSLVLFVMLMLASDADARLLVERIFDQFQ